MARTIAALAIETGIAPNDLMETPDIVLGELLYILEKRRA